MLTDPSQNANQYTDFIMMNQYFGSWAGPAEDLAPALERVGKMFPDKMVVISEFGLAGLFAPDTAQADVKRVEVMRSQLAEFARHDFVAGAVFWCYQDYKSHRNLWPGETSGYVEMGLVDENRQRLPSYYAWKDETSPARLAVEWTRPTYYAAPTGFKATVARRPANELPSYELRGYRLEWEARDHDGALLASGDEDAARDRRARDGRGLVGGDEVARGPRHAAPRASDRVRRRGEDRALVGAALGRALTGGRGEAGPGEAVGMPIRRERPTPTSAP